MIDEYDTMDKPMVSQKETQEGLDLEQVIPPPPYDDFNRWQRKTYSDKNQ